MESSVVEKTIHEKPAKILAQEEQGRYKGYENLRRQVLRHCFDQPDVNTNLAQR